MGCERVNGGGNGEVLPIRDVNLDDCDTGRGEAVRDGARRRADDHLGVTKGILITPTHPAGI